MCTYYIHRGLPWMVCGQPPLHPIWQLIRGCQSRSPLSDRAATLDPFCLFLPTSTTAMTTTTAMSARTYHAWTTHQQGHEGHMTYRDVNGATTMATQTDWGRLPRRSKVQHWTAGGQRGAGKKDWDWDWGAGEYICTYICFNNIPYVAHESGEVAHDWPTTYFHRK